jgi:hypothetical protein
LQANRHTSFGGIFLNGIVRLFLFVIRLWAHNVNSQLANFCNYALV